LKKAIVIENLKVAMNSVRAQWLRALLTMSIIAIGLSALVGILTAIDALKASINSEFSSMGANTFVLKRYSNRVKRGREEYRFAPLKYSEVEAFAAQYGFPARVSVSINAGFTAVAKKDNLKTNPNLAIIGTDAAYLEVSGYRLRDGRNFRDDDNTLRNNVCLLGHEVSKSLFGEKGGVGERILLEGFPLQVIGVLEEKGSSVGFGGDRAVLVPLSVARQRFEGPVSNYTASVWVQNPAMLDAAIGEATGLFRRIRKLNLKDPDDFELRRSDSLAGMLIENLSFVTIAAGIIGFITLLGAAIALMNIMLVTVTERTREIGLRKALGATAGLIRTQFLLEATLICLMGGAVGIALGIAVGNVVGIFTGGSFLLPWNWVGLGFGLCILTGVFSGFGPANRASKLDPVESLRYE
jgi:putative ABC transport system permease protein